jgi:hypothetical protein
VSAASLRSLAKLFRECAAEAEARRDWWLAEHYFGIAAAYERMALKAERAENGQT